MTKDENKNNLREAFKSYLKNYDYGRHYSLKNIRDKFSEDQFDIIISIASEDLITTLENPELEALKDVLTEAINVVGYPDA